MTLEEAKKKWCPMARVVEVNADEGALYGPFNRYHTSVSSHLASPDCQQARCLADDCMMWRWTLLPVKGYCGLAGRPRHDP